MPPSCAHCGEPFGTDSPFSRRGRSYCSPTCRKRAERARARGRVARKEPTMPASLARMLAGETPTGEAAQLLRAIRLARGRYGDRGLCEWLRDAADHLESGCLASLPPLRFPKP